MTLSKLGICILAASFIVSGHATAARKLHQATAIANAAATGNAQVESKAGAVSTGQPTTAVSTAAGQNANVKCEAFAKDSTDYKNCISSGGSSFKTPAAAAAPTVTFEAAPACNISDPDAQCKAKDTQGRCWGFDTAKNQSCAYKDAQGKPIPESQIGKGTTAGAAGTASVTTGTTPSPSPSPKPAPGPAPAGPATATADAQASATAGRKRRSM